MVDVNPTFAACVVGMGFALVAMVWCDTRWSCVAAGAFGLALMAGAYLLRAPYVAAVQFLCVAGSFSVLLLADQPASPKAPPPCRRSKWLAVTLGMGMGCVALALVTTLARQFVTPGATLDPSLAFGDAAAFAAAVIDHHALALSTATLAMASALLVAWPTDRSRS